MSGASGFGVGSYAAGFSNHIALLTVAAKCQVMSGERFARPTQRIRLMQCFGDHEVGRDEVGAVQNVVTAGSERPQQVRQAHGRRVGTADGEKR